MNQPEDLTILRLIHLILTVQSMILH